jgi:hypothetical protein
MEEIILEKMRFEYEGEQRNFEEIFTFIDLILSDTAFVKYRNGQPIGSLAPAYFEAVTMGVADNYKSIYRKDKQKLASAVRKTLESLRLKKFTGPGANSKPKMTGRILAIATALLKV